MTMTLKGLIYTLIVITSGTCFGNDQGARTRSHQVFGNPQMINCENGLYIKGFSGLNITRELKWNHTNYKSNNYGYVVGATLGYQFNIVALEGEFSYRRNTVNELKINSLDIDISGHIEQLCGFGNLLFNIPVTQHAIPYVGVGAGYRHFNPGVNFDQSSDISLRNFIDTADEWGVFQAIGGFNFVLNQLVNMQIEYRYVDGWSNAKCTNQTVDLGLVIRF